MRRHSSLIVLAALAAAGCASVIYPSSVDRNFGAAVTSAKVLQMANPTVAAAPVATGLDGVAAASAMDVYHKSFEAPPAPQNVLNIGVGQSSGSGAR